MHTMVHLHVVGCGNQSLSHPNPRPQIQVGEFKVVQRPAGYPKTSRTNWTFANEDVADAPSADLNRLAKMRDLTADLKESASHKLPPPTNPLTLLTTGQAGKRGPKRLLEGMCEQKHKYTSVELARSVVQWDGKYTDLQEECRAHGISQSGTLKQMLHRLRDHAKLPHSGTKRRSPSLGIAAYFSAPEEKKK